MYEGAAVSFSVGADSGRSPWTTQKTSAGSRTTGSQVFSGFTGVRSAASAVSGGGGGGGGGGFVSSSSSVRRPPVGADASTALFVSFGSVVSPDDPC